MVRKKSPEIGLKVFVDPIEAAKAADLHYVNDQGPYIRRKRAGKGFTYLGMDGKPIHDLEVLKRIKALGIPPAWTDVRVCPDPNGHIQAVGRDAKGRKQYRYHARWREIRAETKYNRMLAFGQALPLIRARVEHDLAQPGLPRDKILALVVRLLETTLIRVGNEEYAQANRSFGLTTLHDRHVDVADATVHFHFRGKSGKEHTVNVHDRRLAQLVKRCKDIPGYELFQYMDEQNQRQTITSSDVNAFLREITGQDFTAKDFRTWGGTVRSVMAFEELGPSSEEQQLKKSITEAVKMVSQQLGNTPAICSKYYLHPAMLEAYRDRSLFQVLHDAPLHVNGLREHEAVVITILQKARPG